MSHQDPKAGDEYSARSFVVHEASLAQLRRLAPNVAVQPWGATEGHNYHLPHGTDVIEAASVGEMAVARANARGARCALLPCIPYGNDNLQLDQVATITMRTGTQLALLEDIALSLVRQGIDRLVILNFHGGNEFMPLIRDVMLAHPIFIVRVNAYQTAPAAMSVLKERSGDHANEMETSLLLHLAPGWVAPLETAGDGAATPSKLPALSSTPGVWAPRDWAALTQDTGVGDPRAATADKGRVIFEAMVEAIAPILVELSAAKNGDFPYVVRERK